MPVKRRSTRKVRTNADGSPMMVGSNPVEDKIAALADQIIARAKETPQEDPVVEKAKKTPQEEPVVEKAKETPQEEPVVEKAKEGPKEVKPIVEHERINPNQTPGKTQDEIRETVPENQAIPQPTPPTDPPGDKSSQPVDSPKKYNREPVISGDHPPMPSSSIEPESSLRNNLSSAMMQNLIVEEDVPLERKNRKLFLIGIVFLAAIILSTGGFMILLKNNSGSIQQTVTLPTSIPPTPTPAFVKSEWTVEVLNGSTTTGLAKKYASILEKQGYTVVKTGNADKKTYKTNELYVQNAMTATVENFIADINSDIKVTSVAGELKDSTAAARIIIGKE